MPAPVMSLPAPTTTRRPPHRSFDPQYAHDPATLARALECHKAGAYDAAWELYARLDTESQRVGKGPHYHARMMAALLWYQRTSRVEFDDPGMGTVIGYLEDVILHKPKWADPRYNLGVVLEGMGRIPEAAARFRQALALDDGHTEAWVNLGNCLLSLGEPEAARAAFQRAEALNPNDPLAKYNLMHALALFGEWDQAHAYWEYRYLMPGHLRDHGYPRPLPRWDGETYVPHLIVTDEQGAGDILQFVRFLPAVAARVGRVSCRVRHPPLLPLLRFNYPDVTFFSEHDPQPRGDAHLPLLSSVSTLAVRETDVPYRHGYLRAPSTHTVSIAPAVTVRLPGLSPTRTVGNNVPVSPEKKAGGGEVRATVGLCWAGSPTHKRNAQRSIPWAMFAPLLDVPHTAFVNLTVGATAAVTHPRLTSPALPDYGATANIVAGCDLVVTVDTSVLHLAGAMGVPVWGLLPAAPDFRWMLTRSDSPWYASLTLWRQDRHGSWPDVLARVSAALATHVNP